MLLLNFGEQKHGALWEVWKWRIKSYWLEHCFCFWFYCFVCFLVIFFFFFLPNDSITFQKWFHRTSLTIIRIYRNVIYQKRPLSETVLAMPCWWVLARTKQLSVAATAGLIWLCHTMHAHSTGHTAKLVVCASVHIVVMWFVHKPGSRSFNVWC